MRWPLVLVVADLEPREFADAATGIGQHREHGPVADAERRRRRRGIEQAAAILRRQADGLAVAWSGRCGDEIGMGRVGSDIAVGLQVRKHRPQDGELAADGTIVPSLCGQVIAPGSDLLRADCRQLFYVARLHAAEDKKLAEVALVIRASVRRWRFQEPGVAGLPA